MAGPDVDFWAGMFARGAMPWDRGEANPALAGLIAQGVLRAGMRIVVPGCGSGYELPVLAQAGLDVIALDYTPAAVERARALVATLPASVAARVRVEQADVLQWNPPAPVDAVYEQTCLCALHPDHWVDYAARLRDWLAPEGLLIAQFVQAQRPGAAEGFVEGPPYHCDIHGMRALFAGRDWIWPKPPYPRAQPKPGLAELMVLLRPALRAR